jgi:hypothetical protein
MYDLKELRAAANKACKLAFEERANIPGAINWVDLGCHEAMRWENDQGDTGYTVTIEEASPGQPQLGLFIGAHLRASGFENVNVVFEW